MDNQASLDASAKLRAFCFGILMVSLRLEDDRAIFHWTLTGTNTRPGGTGRAVRIKATKFGKSGQRA